MSLRAVVRVFRKKECCGADLADFLLRRLKARHDVFDIIHVDISESPSLTEKFGHRLPVIYKDDEEVASVKVDLRTLKKKLGIPP